MSTRPADPAEPVAPRPDAAERLLRDTAVQGDAPEEPSRAPDVEREAEHPTQPTRDDR